MLRACGLAVQADQHQRLVVRFLEQLGALGTVAFSVRLQEQDEQAQVARRHVAGARVLEHRGDLVDARRIARPQRVECRDEAIDVGLRRRKVCEVHGLDAAPAAVGAAVAGSDRTQVGALPVALEHVEILGGTGVIALVEAQRRAQQPRGEFFAQVEDRIEDGDRRRAGLEVFEQPAVRITLDGEQARERGDQFALTQRAVARTGVGARADERPCGERETQRRRRCQAGHRPGRAPAEATPGAAPR